MTDSKKHERKIRRLMNPLKNNGQSPRRPRQSKNVFTTKNGTDIRVNRSFNERRKARKDAVARQRAARLSVLPQNRFKRLMYRMHPKRLAAYWFSREGAIMGLKLAGVGIVVCFLLLVGLFAYFRKDLPDITDVSGNNSPGSISYYDKTGQTLLWQDYDAVKRIPVPYERQSDYIRNATIAIEDKDFYSEGAFNVRGIARAAVDNALNKGGPRQGGSTITQQLVKLNLNWTNDRSYTRKIKELILAVELEREYSKNDIITGYLNSAPYGGIEVGVESAARDYFNTTAKDLTLAQAAFLAAIPQAPAYYSPYNTETFEKDLLVGRSNYILDRMVEQKMVTRQEAEAAKKVDVVATVRPLQPKYAGIKAPYFVLAAKNELNSSYLGDSTQRGGWKVYTTLDMDLQNIAEKQVADGIERVRLQGGTVAALIAEDVKTGEIVAAVGGPDFNNEEYGKLNFASSVQVSPGSSVKPYDYASFIDKSNNVGGGSVLYDTQGPLPGYACTDKRTPDRQGNNGGNCLQNYDFRYPGPLTLRYALGGSRNVPAVKAVLSMDADQVKSVNKNISVINGLMAKDKAYVCYPPGTDVFAATPKDESQCYGSSALGDGAYLHLDDHVNGIASLSRLGQAMKKTYISRIIDADNKPIEMHKRDTKQIIRPDSAYIINDMASDRKASYLNGLNSCAGPCSFHDYKGWKFAIKTGTTNDAYDGLMASWSGRYAAVAWVGHHTRTVEMSGSMERMTGPIVRGWMQGAHDKLGGEPQNWQQPKGVKTLPAYVIRSKVSRLGESVPSSATDLYPSWYQPKTTSNASATIDRVSNKIATDCTPEAAKQFVSNSNANNFSVDQFVGGSRGGANMSATDDIHRCDDQKPSVNLTVSSNGSGNPTTTCDEDGCTITATVTQGTHALASDRFPGKLTLTVNGQNVRSFDISGTGSPQTFSHSFTPSGDGTAQISANVTDSVLYGASNSTSVSTSGGGGGNNDDEDDEQAVAPLGNGRRGGRSSLLNPFGT